MPYAEKRNKLSLFMLSRRKLRGVFVFFFAKKLELFTGSLRQQKKGWQESVAGS